MRGTGTSFRRWLGVAGLLVTGTVGAAPAGKVALDVLPAPGESWLRVETTNFVLITDGPRRRAERLGARLEELREVLAATSSGMKVTSPVPTWIFVFDETETFLRYGLLDDARPTEVAGYFVRGIDGNYVGIDGASAAIPYPVIFHEYLHHFLQDNVPGIPLWLDEGLAEVYGTFEVTGGVAKIALPDLAHLRTLREKPMIPLAELFAVDNRSPDYNEGERRGMLYAQSWALAHFLLADPGRRERMGGLLTRLAAGTPSAEAFAAVYGLDLAALEQALAAYVRQEALGYVSYAPERGFAAHEARVAPLEHVEVLYHLGDLLAHIHPLRTEQIERHLRAVLELDPRHTGAIVALAVVRLMEERPDEASALCEKALALAPHDTRALTVHGMTLLERFRLELDAQRDESTVREIPGDATAGPLASLAASLDLLDELPASTPPLLEAARARFRQALETADEHVEALHGLGRTYLFDRGDLAEGSSATARASRLAPARTDVLRDLIVLTARSGNVSGARNLFERALVPRGVAEDSAEAERVLVAAELREIQPLLRERKTAPALERLRELARAAQAAELRERLEALEREVLRAESVERARRLRDEAHQALAAGDTAKATALSRQAQEIAAAMDAATGGTELERLNLAIAQANAGDYESAQAGLARLAAATNDPALRELATRRLAEVAAAAALDRGAERYNEAVGAFNAGELERAGRILDALLADDPPERVAAGAHQLLREVRRRLGGR